ncbi:MAG: hypothetical protein L0216_15865 [Planctomycetales bacterium]|nr:hypothetical protein [Planctomycetales bacterium]
MTRGDLALAVALVAAAPGCLVYSQTRIGAPPPEHPEGHLEPGKTTRREVLARLGPPDRIVRQHDGALWQYIQGVGNAFRLRVEFPFVLTYPYFHYDDESVRFRVLTVLLDGQNVVQGFGTSGEE